MWKTCKILYPSLPTQAQHATYLLCSEEDMAEGGCDSSGPQGILPPSKGTKSEVWAYFGFYKNAQGQLVKDCSPICSNGKKKVVARGGKHIQFTYSFARSSLSTVQQMRGQILTQSCSEEDLRQTRTG